MKKTLAVFAVFALLGVGSVASAHTWGYGGHGGNGYGPMWGAYNTGPEEQKFFDETVTQRAELNAKLFEYNEAVRTGDTARADSLAKDIEKLNAALGTKAPGWGRAGFCGGPYSR